MVDIGETFTITVLYQQYALFQGQQEILEESFISAQNQEDVVNANFLGDMMKMS